MGLWTDINRQSVIITSTERTTTRDVSPCHLPFCLCDCNGVAKRPKNHACGFLLWDPHLLATHLALVHSLAPFVDMAVARFLNARCRLLGMPGGETQRREGARPLERSTCPCRSFIISRGRPVPRYSNMTRAQHAC